MSLLHTAALKAMLQKAIQLIIKFENEFFADDQVEAAMEYVEQLDKIKQVHSFGQQQACANKLHESGAAMAYRNIELTGNMKLVTDADGRVFLTDFPDQYNDNCK